MTAAAAPSEEQVSAILDGKRVLGPPRDVQEVRNAITAYDRAEGWAPSSESDLLAAHEVLLGGLAQTPGRYRTGEVGVVGPKAIHHIGPPAERVPELMAELLAWLRETREHPLIASSVFHYEFEDGFQHEANDAVREGSPQETPHVSPQVERLLRVLDGEMSRREVLVALDLRDRKWLRQAYLGPALKDGLIEMARPETPNARNQRYRLTPAGRRLRGRTP